MLESMMRAFGMQGSIPKFDAAATNTIVSVRSRATRVTLIEVTNINLVDVWLQMFNETPVTGSPTLFEDGTGKILATCVAHGLVTNDIIVVTGTTSYNGTWTITKVDADSFTFVDTYVADETSGAFTCHKIILGTTAPYRSYQIPAGDTVNRGSKNIPLLVPLKFSNELCYAITTTYNGSTAAGVVCVLNMEYIDELL